MVTVSAFVSVHCVPQFLLHDMSYAHRKSHGKLGWGTVSSWLLFMLHKDVDLHYFKNHKQDGKLLHVRTRKVNFYFCPTKIPSFFTCQHDETKVCEIFTISKEI